jgi:hypothetical protein
MTSHSIISVCQGEIKSIESTNSCRIHFEILNSGVPTGRSDESSNDSEDQGLVRLATKTDGYEKCPMIDPSARETNRLSYSTWTRQKNCNKKMNSIPSIFIAYRCL